MTGTELVASLDIPPGWAVVIASTIGAVLAAIGGIALWWLRQIDKRSDAQEARIAKLEARDRKSWLYIQNLIVHAHTHAPGVALPPPPPGWMDED